MKKKDLYKNPQAEKIFVCAQNKYEVLCSNKTDSKSFVCSKQQRVHLSLCCEQKQYQNSIFNISQMHFKSTWMCVLDIWWEQNHTESHADRGSLFKSRNRLNNIAFVAEITHSCRTALCPWQLNLTAFVLLCLCICNTSNPTPRSLQLIWCAAHQTPFTANKRDPWQETSRIRMTSALRWHPLCYQNRPRPRHFLRLIKLYLTHVSMVGFWLGEEGWSSKSTECTDNECFVSPIIWQQVDYRWTGS